VVFDRFAHAPHHTQTMKDQQAKIMLICVKVASTPVAKASMSVSTGILLDESLRRCLIRPVA
jgi:hypothetical protein